MPAFELNNTYSFKTKAPIALGMNRTNVICIGQVRYAEATTINTRPLAVIAADVRVELGQQDLNYTKYTYYVFEEVNGSKFALPLEWIDQLTISNVTQATTTFVFDSLNSEKKQEIIQFLALRGITNYRVE